MFINEMNDAKYYFSKFISFYPSYMEMLNDCTTKGERNAIKQRMIADMKKEEYPKGITKEVAIYIKSL